MRTLALRLVRVLGALAVVAVLAFGFVQLNATAAAVDHCELVPGPDQHCEDVGDCLPECEMAVMVRCIQDPPNQNCCECIF